MSFVDTVCPRSRKVQRLQNPRSIVSVLVNVDFIGGREDGDEKGDYCILVRAPLIHPVEYLFPYRIVVDSTLVWTS